MGEVDTQRQALNVFRMELMGATVHPVTCGTKTLKDATNEALRDWVANVNDTHYLIGSVVGPHPFPTIVRDFQSVIGREAGIRSCEKREECRTPSLPASAGARMRSVSSTRSLTMMWNSSASKRPGKDSIRRSIPQPSAPVIPACFTGRSRTCCRIKTGRCSPRTVWQPDSIIPG